MPTIDIPDRICPHCGGTKYYHRVYKRISKVTGKNYEFYECRTCNIKSSKNYALNNKDKVKEIKLKSYLKYKNDSTKKEKNRINTKKYRKSKRNNLEYIKRTKNSAKKAFQTLKNSLSDRYIKFRLMYTSGKKVLDKEDVPQELVELKRKQLLLKRKIKNNG
jgi:hypothetical protein